MKILNKFIYFVIFFNVAWLCALFAQKEGLHIDEQWTYAFSNSSIGTFFHSFDLNNIDPVVNKWQDGNDIEKYFTVQKNERFDYENAYKNLSHDVHPPLYYYLLHTICSLFLNNMSVYLAGFINIVFFALSLFLLFKISKLYINDDILATIPVLWYGFSTGGIDTFLYIRMYGLLVFWALMFFYFSILYFRSQTINNKYLSLIFIAVLGGCLTHFFFIVYTACFVAFYSVKYLFKKEYRKVLLFLLVSFIACISLFALFEPSLDILRKSNRAKGISTILHNIIASNNGNLMDAEWIKTLYLYFLQGGYRFFYHLWNMSFGEINIDINIKLWLSLFICTSLCFMGFFYIVAVFLALGFYIGIFFPEMWIFEGRYFMILLPFWSLFLVIFFYKTLKYFAIFKNNIKLKRITAFCLILCFLINSNFGANSLYLFKKQESDIKFAETVKEKNIVVMVPELWMFFETLYYIKGAKNIYVMISSNINDIKDTTHLGKDTLVLMLNYDARRTLKLKYKKPRNLNILFKNLEFMYIVQFSERFYDVYKMTSN